MSKIIKITDKISSEICSQYQSGLSSLIIAKNFAMSKSRVLSILKRNNIPRRNKIDCVKQNKLTIEEMYLLAQTREGHCLSDIYVGVNDPLEWKCKCGYRWFARPSNVKSGSWCPRCASRKPKKYSLQDVIDYAEKHDGTCLSDIFESSHKYLMWQCQSGHTWRAKYCDMIRRDSWCPYCMWESNKLGIEVAQEIAKLNYGKCLSAQYIDCEQKLEWACFEGHRWFATLNNVKNNHSWCPYCKGSYSERKFREVLEQLTGRFFPRRKPSWLRNNSGNRLEIDGFNEKFNLGFEFQGIQHFKFIKYMHKNIARYRKQKGHDKIKKRIFEKKKINIMYPDYLLVMSEFEDFIVQFLKKRNLQWIIAKKS